jgi:hypothetical protein
VFDEILPSNHRVDDHIVSIYTLRERTNEPPKRNLDPSERHCV